ncbi:GPP34 family phosphoprotein [Jannaschia sp. R86511]|uniref:GOLPH3/VPS74 family protein n=1 Tax=Jannaschia sp. R86511 TaxID=3093853 RepID=UPI0036D369D4
MTTTDEAPLLVEDLMLLLFDPRSGTIAGEGTLFYTLAGALLTDLALQDRVAVDEGRPIVGPKVRAVGDEPPADDLLREVWQQIKDKPRGVQTVLAAAGPTLREPVLERLVQAGHVDRTRGKALGFIPTTRLSDGGSGRRDELLAQVRPVLVDGAEPAPRVAVLAALLSASDSLPALHHDIPWSGDVYTNGKRLERGDWGAATVGEAVTRTAVAVAMSSVSVAIAVNPGH